MEIDIIAWKNNCIHFFEVRKRKIISCDYPPISQKKLENIYLCALNFLENNPQYQELKYSVDLITMDQKGNMDFFHNITLQQDRIG